MLPFARLYRIVPLAIGLPLLWSCAESGDVASPVEDDVPIQLTIVSGDGQGGEAGEELALPLVVAVTDDRDQPLRRRVVNFRVIEGGGSMFAGSALTDQHGLAADWWTLGTAGAQAVEVRSVSPDGTRFVHARFTATITGDEPPPPPTEEDLDGDGYTGLDGDCNDADAAVHPGAEDTPDGNFVDSDCDGIDGTLALSTFVAVSGSDVAGCGDWVAPCRSIQAGLWEAQSQSRRDVLVGAGTYTESVELVDRVNLYGGYGPDYAVRSPAALYVSHMVSPDASPTLLGETLAGPIVVADLTIEAPDLSDAPPPFSDGGDAGDDSRAIRLTGVPAGALTITRTILLGGEAAPGAQGAGYTGLGWSPADDGGPGASGLEEVVACDDERRGAGGFGAGSGSMRGGNGGAGGTMDSSCPFDFDAEPGLAGDNAVLLSAAPPLGTGGPGGQPCLSGIDGEPGVPGQDGSHGAGGQVINGFLALAGADGTLGAAGGGGGGGGGAGGCDTSTDSYGAGGGGGGAGGLANFGAGLGGGPGGKSMVVHLIDSSPALIDNTIALGSGGRGGDGGDAYPGQPGGAGGSGGLPASSDDGRGGNGGRGGDGGDSGAGGGGAGGPSIGVVMGGTSSPVLSGNDFLAGVGSGGPGGTGGAPGGNDGESGARFETLTYTF